MATLQERIHELSKNLDEVASRLEPGSSASPALRAVVGELQSKAQRAEEQAGSSAEQPALRESIIELEQAADSAKAAAQAESGLDEENRSALIRVHSEASALKKELTQAAGLAPEERSPSQEKL